MAFDRHQSTLATFQPQASIKFSTGNNGTGVWPFCMPDASVQKPDTSYMLWSNGANDEPYSFIGRVQNGLISRRPSDLSDSDRDGETDLQGLVSNILDEAESQSGYNGRDLLASNSIWSPKTTRDELQECFQSESKTQHFTTFCSNYASSVTSNTVNTDAKDVFQQDKEPAMSQQWLVNIPKGDKDYLNYCPTKLPPGLPIPNTANAYQSYLQQERHDRTTVNEKRGNKSYLDSFPDLSNVFNSQSETTNIFIHSPYEDNNNNHNSVKPSNNEQYVSHDPNQLVTGFQSFMASENDVSLHGTFADIDREAQGRLEDWMGEHWKFSSSSMPTHGSTAAQTQKEMMGAQMERNRVMRSEMVNCDSIQDLYGFSTQNAEHFQQPKMFSGSLSLNNDYQTKMTMQKKNNLFPFTLKDNQCLKQQDHIQSKIKSQMQKEKRMSGIHGENLYISHVTNCSTKGGEKNQQNLDHFGIMQSQRFGGENGRVSAKNGQQFMSCVYPANDSKRHLSMKSSNYHSRSTLSHGNPAPGVAIGNMMPANETTNADVNDLMTQRGDPTYHGLKSAMTTSAVTDDMPMVELHFYLDECCDQLRFLEKERKKTEIILSKAIQGGKTISDTTTFLPKLPPNPTRIDHLIANQMKEQRRVASVLHRMESLNIFLHNNIHTALKKHYMAISVTEARRKEEIVIMSQQQQHREYFEDYKDTLLMVMALKDLAATTRRLCTALWCALQIVLPKAVKSQDQATGRARSPSPYEGGSFKF